MEAMKEISGILIKTEDEDGYFTYREALNLEINEWRLPTKKELEFLFNDKENTAKMNLVDYWYRHEDGDIFMMNRFDRIVNKDSYKSFAKVRLVRDINREVINEE